MLCWEPMTKFVCEEGYSLCKPDSWIVCFHGSDFNLRNACLIPNEQYLEVIFLLTMMDCWVASHPTVPIVLLGGWYGRFLLYANNECLSLFCYVPVERGHCLSVFECPAEPASDQIIMLIVFPLNVNKWFTVQGTNSTSQGRGLWVGNPKPSWWTWMLTWLN